jgi:hypothetical protein
MFLTRSQIHFLFCCAKQQQELIDAEMNKSRSDYSSSPGNALHIDDGDDPETIREKVKFFKEQAGCQ